MRNHRIPRLFVEDGLELDKVFSLSKEQSHYILTVLRKSITDRVLVFNGREGEFETEIIINAKNNCQVKIIKKTREFKMSPDLTLIFSPVKNIKPEFIIQKATELGVREIIPCLFKNTVKTGANFDRLRHIAIEASEQCERIDVPEIKEITNFGQIVSDFQLNTNILFCDESGQGKPIYAVLKGKKKGEKWVIIIGPEGGFDKSEIDHIYSLPNVFGVGLGARILKAETAAFAAISIWQSVLGDFDQLPDFRAN